jgi:F-type H+-transporting ATPase subunit delta
MSRTKTIDVVGQQIGVVYAAALYEAAAAQGFVGEILAQFDSLVGDVLDRFPEFEEVLASPRVHETEKKQLIDQTLGPQASGLLTNFLKVLAERDRLGYLRQIRDELDELHVQREGRVRVEVTTAIELDEPALVQLREDIRRQFGKEPILATSVDPTLIGGVQLRFGDRVYDGSVASELDRVRAVINQRNKAEIDIHPEQFQENN